MAAGVRIVVNTFPPSGENPEYYDTGTFTTVAGAISGIASGFLTFTPSYGSTSDLSPQADDTTMAVAVTSIKAIIPIATIPPAA